jgi:hypothetical protein
VSAPVNTDPFQNAVPCCIRARSRAWRVYWLRYWHAKRLFGYLARGGKFGQAEACQDAVYRYEDLLDLPSTKGYEP